jgi:hypothetical protein
LPIYIEWPAAASQFTQSLAFLRTAFSRVIKKAHPKLDAFQAHPAAKSVMANWPNMGGTTIAVHLSRLITGG